MYRSLPFLFLLGACTTVPPINCPPLVSYTKVEQDVAANQLPSAGSQIQVFVVDYIKLRQECRAK